MNSTLSSTNNCPHPETWEFNIDHPLFCPIKSPPLEVRFRDAVEWVGLVLEIGPEGWINRDPKWRPAPPEHPPVLLIDVVPPHE